jgi:hypothetical protein
MAYSKTTWVDDSAPALDAAHLNNIEDGIENLDGRVTANESTLTTHLTSINSNTTTLTTLTSDLSALEDSLDDMIVIRQGTFSGNWQPTLTSTFGITTPANYNWTVSVHQTSRVSHNGQTVTLQGYVGVDGDTLQFTSTSDSTSIAAYYTIVGYRKTFSNASIVNQ